MVQVPNIHLGQIESLREIATVILFCLYSTDTQVNVILLNVIK